MPSVVSNASVLICLGATQRPHLPAALKPILDALVQQHSFRLSRNLYEQFLRQAGETPCAWPERGHMIRAEFDRKFISGHGTTLQ